MARMMTATVLLAALASVVVAAAAATAEERPVDPWATAQADPMLYGAALPFLAAQQSAGTSHTYVRSEFANQTNLYVTMRDGVQLWTAVYIPDGAGPFSTVLERTPYTIDGAGGLASVWNSRGFVFVAQDQRGSGRSTDDGRVRWTYWRMDGQDAYDTMAWITNQTWSNKEVYMTGGSANGIAVLAGMHQSPPWLRGIAPVVASAEMHSTTYQGGAFRTALIQWWLRLNLFDYLLPTVFEHEALDSWWDGVTLRGKESVCAYPGVHWGGWWDIFANETISAFEMLQYNAPDDRCRGQQYLVLDPHGHCAGGAVPWPSSRTNLPDDLAHYIFLKQSGRPIPAALSLRVERAEAITFYVMGPAESANGNYWTTLPAWPQAVQRKYFLHPNGRLDASGPPQNGTINSATFTYDPLMPVRTKGGPELLWPCGPRVQNLVLDRPDVLVFTSDPMLQPTAFVGAVTAALWVSTDRNDTDITVKLMDIAPVTGIAMLLQDGVLRLRWRQGPSAAVPTVPGEVYPVVIDLWRTAYVLERGHSLAIAISSSNYPRFAVNPNTGAPIGNEQAGNELVAQNKVYFDTSRPSSIVLPIVPLTAIPRNFVP